MVMWVEGQPGSIRANIKRKTRDCTWKRPCAIITFTNACKVLHVHVSTLGIYF